jgi:hypothetical protein
MNKIKNKGPPKPAGRYHSLGLICRQQAARYPEASWRWLSEAERFEHLAAKEIQRNLTEPPKAPRDEKAKIDGASRQ